LPHSPTLHPPPCRQHITANIPSIKRRLFIQKLANWLNKDPDFLKKKGIETEEFIRRTSKARYDGFRLQSAAGLEQGR